jgi:rhamnogalacturonan hydrolase
MAFLTRLTLFSLLLLQYITFTRADHVVKRATGALTPLSSKSKKCSVLDYGGVADGTTDIGPAISKAFTSCAKAGGATLVVPAGNYSSES